MLLDAHMLRAEIKKMKNIYPTHHRTKDGDRETKQGENMIQIIVLNIAECNYQQNGNNTRLYGEPERAWACQRCNSLPVTFPSTWYFSRSFVGASETISLRFC